jgi:hypothetical protein
MFRNLKTIEIVEGALLADIAVVAQLIAVYLPFIGDVFRSLIFLAFAILVLRRGLYPALFGLGTALFLIVVLMGPAALPLLLIECVGGLYLGTTMRLRVPPLIILVIGVLCGALSLCLLITLILFLSGRSMDGIRQIIEQFDHAVGQISAWLFAKVGLAAWWQQNLAPPWQALTNWMISYWWLAIYILACGFMVPVVAAIYTFTNLFVRLLGHQVYPFPGKRVERLITGTIRGSLKTLSRLTGGMQSLRTDRSGKNI